MKKNVYTYHMKTANHPPASPAFKKKHFFPAFMFIHKKNELF